MEVLMKFYYMYLELMMRIKLYYNHICRLTSWTKDYTITSALCYILYSSTPILFFLKCMYIDDVLVKLQAKLFIGTSTLVQSSMYAVLLRL